MGVETAVVTGASRGIGRAFCFALAEAGISNIIAVSKTIENLERLREELHQRFPTCRVRVVPADLTDPLAENTEFLRIRRVVEVYGKLDILVNNAGNFEELALPRQDVGESELAALLRRIDYMYRLNGVAPAKLYATLMPLLLHSEQPIGIDNLSQINHKFFSGNIGYAPPKMGHEWTSLAVVAETLGRLRTHRVYAAFVDTASTKKYEAPKLTPEQVAGFTVGTALAEEGDTDIALRSGPVGAALRAGFRLKYKEYRMQEGYDADRLFDDHRTLARARFACFFQQ